MSNDTRSLKEILYSNTSLEDFLVSMIKDMMENLMKAELTELLNYEKYSSKGHNTGIYQRSFETKYGKLENLNIPRERNNEFKQQLIQPYSRREGWLIFVFMNLHHYTYFIHISHILSDRLSSRPLIWKELGAGQMAKLRVFRENGGDIFQKLLDKKKENKKHMRIGKLDSEMLEKRANKRIREQMGNIGKRNIGKRNIGKRTGAYKAILSLRGA